MKTISLSSLLLVVLLLPLRMAAQFYDTGTDPASLKWKQIRTKNFRLVFPSDYEKEAAKAASYLEDASLKLNDIYRLPARRPSLDIVIHNHSIESNGYVAIAPNRMELYPMSEQNSLPVDFHRRLINHEMVHVKQISALQTGVTGFLSRFGGQQYTGVVAAMLPFWFLEGDAIIYETLLTPGGRGNNPSFNKELKALYMGIPGGYKFDKMLLGSYRDHTPSHYHYGFRMMEYSRSRYGNDLWKDNISYIAANPFLINPLNFKLKKSVSTTKKKLFADTFEEFSKIWSYETQLDAPLEYDVLNPLKNDNYTNYHSPAIIGTDSLIAFKSSISKPLSIVLITDKQKEKHLLYTGSVDPYFLSYGGGRIVWAELQQDIRWENRGFSVIAVHNITSGQTTRITNRSRLFAPAVSPDGGSIAAVEVTTTSQNRLVLLDPETGTITREISLPEEGFAQRPAWSGDGQSISIILLTSKGEGIFIYSLTSDDWRMVLEPSSFDLQSAFVRNDTTFFVSSSGGTDNIFLKTPGGDIGRITRTRFGTGSFSLSGNRFVFTDYDHTGFSIVSTRLTVEQSDYYGATVRPSSLINSIELPVVQNTEPSGSDGLRIPDYEITPYRKWQNPLRFHSWTPFYFDLDEITTDPSSVTPGITIFSQNLLSSVITSIGYQYTEGQHKIHSGITWKGWYPVVDFRLSYGGEPSIITGDNDVEPSVIYPSLSTGTEIYLPLQFTSGAWSQYLRASVYHRYNNRYIYDESDEVFDYGQSFVSYKLFFSNSRRSSYRDIFPVFAQALELNYTNAPFDSEIYGTSTSMRASFYFPGMLRNHGLRIRIQAEKQVPEEYIQYNRINYPRGYSDIISERLRTLSGDYVFPIAYPDFAAGGIFYLKRIRGSLWFDRSQGSENIFLSPRQYVPEKLTFSSIGAELLTDFNLLRMPFDITGGARAGYIPSQKRSFLEAVFSVDIYGFSLGERIDERIPWL